VGPRSDVFSLGVVLYEMLTGIAPFDADTVNSIMYQTVNMREEPVSKINAAVAPPLDSVVAKALAKNQDERYASMKEFYRALRDALKSLPEPGHLVLPAVQVAQTSPGFPAVKISDLPAFEEAPHHVSAKFDSFEGTMRLAALTEQGADITRFMKRPPVEALTPAPAPLPAREAAPAKAAAADTQPDLPFPVMPAALLGSLAGIAVVLGVVLLLR